jgi:hypothetical protein
MTWLLTQRLLEFGVIGLMLWTPFHDLRNAPSRCLAEWLDLSLTHAQQHGGIPNAEIVVAAASGSLSLEPR